MKIRARDSFLQVKKRDDDYPIERNFIIMMFSCVSCCVLFLNLNSITAQQDRALESLDFTQEKLHCSISHYYNFCRLDGALLVLLFRNEQTS